VGTPSEVIRMDKGCFPGRQAVVTGGRPLRRLVRLHLDGSSEPSIDPGAEIRDGSGAVVGVMGTMAYHLEQGPIGLGLVSSGVPRRDVWIDDVSATLEFLQPEV
jgi:folate-binding Fe-S cluster repair protein YgfZ